MKFNYSSDTASDRPGLQDHVLRNGSVNLER